MTVSDRGGKELLKEIRAVHSEREDRVESPEHSLSLDVIPLYGVALGDKVIPMRGSALAEPDVEFHPGKGRSFLAFMREAMEERDPHAEEPSAQRHLNELLYLPPFPSKRASRSRASVHEAWLGAQASASLSRFSAKAREHLDHRQAEELGKALERILDEGDAAEDLKALEGLDRKRLSATERMAAVSGGFVRRFEFEKQQLRGSLSASEVSQRKRRSVERIERLRTEGLLLALEDPEGEWRYPRWQFASASSGRLVRGLRGVLEELRSLPPLVRIAWLKQPKPSLDNRSPLEALREGERRKVRLLARAVRGASG
jgi:hypothetical protein